MSGPEAEPLFISTGIKELTLVKRTEGSQERNSAQFNFQLHVSVSSDSTGEPTSITMSNENTLQI